MEHDASLTCFLILSITFLIICFHQKIIQTFFIIHFGEVHVFSSQYKNLYSFLSFAAL